MTSLSPAGFAALLLLAAFPGPLAHAHASGLAPVGFRPGSMGLSTTAGGVSAATPPSPTYDEQIGATFVQSLSSLTYNVTALAQTGTDGYGPAYILNGLSSAGYWYQVGVSYHWPSSSGGYYTGFGFNYQVYSPTGRSVFPTNGGSGLGGFSKTIDSGDNVLLTLAFSGASVTMSAEDTVTGAVAKTSYSAVGASTFVGDSSGPANSQGFFSGIMTEWYHVGQYTGTEGKVTYTNSLVALTSAWLWADEFDSASSGPPVFDNQTKTPVTFADVNQIYPFETNGATIYGAAHEFITGLLNSATSILTLEAFNKFTAYPGFTATYTLAGLQQTSVLGQQSADTIEADPNTLVTVTINSTSQSGLEKWGFSGTPSASQVTFTVGQDVTYFYYELVEETVSATVAAGGEPFPSPPELFYTIPNQSVGGEVTAVANLTSSPSQLFALVDTTISAGNITVSSVRWTAPSGEWTVSAPNAIPEPIEYYQQYQMTVEYFLAGGGNPPEVPEFTFVAFGVSQTVPITGGPGYLYFGPPPAPPVPTGTNTVWADDGSRFSSSDLINGSTPFERWIGTGTTIGANATEGPLFHNPFGKGSITGPQRVALTYTHQYYDTLGVSNPNGGSLSGRVSIGTGGGNFSPGQIWYAVGTNLTVTASPNEGWALEAWNGNGTGAYNGTNQTLDLTVEGVFADNATFFPGLTLAADPRTVITYSCGGAAATCPPPGTLSGTTKTFYLPPGTQVSLRAHPNSFIYSFASWMGSAGESRTPSFSLSVDTPQTMSAASSYNIQVLAGLFVVALAAVVAVALAVRSRRRRNQAYGPWPA